MRDRTTPTAPQHPPACPRYARIRVAVEQSGASRSYIYRQAAVGRVKLKKAGRTTLVCMESLMAVLDALPEARIGQQAA